MMALFEQQLLPAKKMHSAIGVLGWDPLHTMTPRSERGSDALGQGSSRLVRDRGRLLVFAAGTTGADTDLGRAGSPRAPGGWAVPVVYYADGPIAAYVGEGKSNV